MNKLTISLCIIIITYFIYTCVIYKQNIIELFKSKTVAKYQHNNVTITDDTLSCLDMYRYELLKRVAKVLHENNIKYFVGHGNLIEIKRNKQLIHDDDIDIRFDKNSKSNLVKYFKTLVKTHDGHYLDSVNHLIFSKRHPDINNINWTQAVLDINDINNEGFNDFDNFKDCFNKYFSNNVNIKHSNFNVHSDITIATRYQENIIEVIWDDFQYVFDHPLENVIYKGVNVTIPNKEMSDKILTYQYGKNYITPNKNFIYENGTYFEKYRVIDKLLLKHAGRNAKPINNIEKFIHICLQ